MAVFCSAPPTSPVTVAWEGYFFSNTGRGSWLGESLKLVHLQVEITLAIAVHLLLCLSCPHPYNSVFVHWCGELVWLKGN